MSVQKVGVDWSRVTVEHVRRACELYDAGAEIPKRSAQSTFLLLNGNTYPGKFIRGLAYRLATGIDLDPEPGLFRGSGNCQVPSEPWSDNAAWWVRHPR